MKSQVLDSLAGLTSFAVYFLGSMVLLLLFCSIYLLVTPYNELKLIREDGKTAPAISLGGAVLGFTLPLASAISHSVSFLDMVIWALVALLVQILTFLTIRVGLPTLVKAIADDKNGAAALVAVISLAAGIINAASMTY
jgi:putative membrane protein